MMGMFFILNRLPVMHLLLGCRPMKQGALRKTLYMLNRLKLTFVLRVTVGRRRFVPADLLA